MILFRTCWHRNFILLVLVCVCWNGSVARQKAREHEQNEPSTQSTPRVSANATTATTTTPKEQGLELEQPHKTSGNFSAYWLTIKCESHMFCAVYPLIFAKTFHWVVFWRVSYAMPWVSCKGNQLLIVLCIVSWQAYSISDVKESGFADMCRMAFARVEDQSATCFVMDSACQWMNYPGFRNFPKLSVVIRESGAVYQTMWEVERWPFFATTEPSTNTVCELFALASARDTHTNRTKRTLDALCE